MSKDPLSDLMLWKIFFRFTHAVHYCSHQYVEERNRLVLTRKFSVAPRSQSGHVKTEEPNCSTMAILRGCEQAWIKWFFDHHDPFAFPLRLLFLFSDDGKIRRSHGTPVLSAHQGGDMRTVRFGFDVVAD